MGMDSMLRVQHRMDEIMDRFEPRPRVASPPSTREASASPNNVVAPAASHSRGAKFSAMLDSMIESQSREQGISSDLVRAVVKAESGGNPAAVSPKGALGLMQLMPETAKTLRVDPLDPAENLEGGIRYLRTLAERYGDLDRTLAAYNAGPGAVDRWKGVPPYAETREYVQRIKKSLLYPPGR